MAATLIIFGGSGFIGQALCKEALNRHMSVVSISKHGKPKSNDKWMSNPLITWCAIDVFKDDSWKYYLSSDTCCINLIGILFENKKKGLTYDKMIVEANRLISTEAEKKNCPYLFLSAKGGPCGYVKAKKAAEESLFDKNNPTIIIRSGLVTTKERPFAYIQGLLIKGATYVPLLKSIVKTVYPTSLNSLVHQILNEISEPSYKLISDIH